MYKFRLAQAEDMDKIFQIKMFDLDLSKSPRFYIMTKAEELVSFTLVNTLDNTNYIQYIYENNLNSDETDFFYRSLNYLLGENPCYSPYFHEGYSKKEDNEYYRLVLPKKTCGGHGSSNSK